MNLMRPQVGAIPFNTPPPPGCEHHQYGISAVRVIFVWPWKMVSVSVHYLFYQPMDEKIKTWTLRFSAQENPNNYEEGIVQLANRVAVWCKSEGSIDTRKFLDMKFFHLSIRLTNQPKATRVCIWLINESNRCICVCLFFLFCLHIFISRSYENRFTPRIFFCQETSCGGAKCQLFSQANFLVVTTISLEPPRPQRNSAELELPCQFSKLNHSSPSYKTGSTTMCTAFWIGHSLVL